MSFPQSFFTLITVSAFFVPSCFAVEPLVIFDAGHDPTFSGAVSACGKREVEYNDELVSIISTNFTHKFLKTREPGFPPHGLDNAGYSNRESLKVRVDFSNKFADEQAIFISVHHDSNSERYLQWNKNLCGGRGGRGLSPEFKEKYAVGFNIFVFDDESKRAKESIRLATLIGEKLISFGRSRSNYHLPESDDCKSCRPVFPEVGVWHQNLYVLRENLLPSILIEVGNIVDPEDERISSSENYKRVLVDVLNESVSEFFLTK